MWAGSSKWDKETEPMGEINVTPLVDVMLVLLIIFRVITIRKNGKIYLQKHTIGMQQLAPRIKAIRKQKPKLPVFIRGDAKTPYGRVAQVMSLLSKAGIQEVGLVTEPGH